MTLLHFASYLSAILLFLSIYVRPASAHGMMCTPRQRGAYRSTKCGYDLPFPQNPVTDHCAHCLNGGTVAVVQAHLPPGGWTVYEPTKNFDATERAGLCGDAAGHNYHMIGGDFMPLRYQNVPMVAHWKTGGVVDFVAQIDTNHNGYFEFFLCDLDSCHSPDITGKCFRNGHCHKLNRVPHPDCEDPRQDTHYECGPIDTEYPGRWYLPCRNIGNTGMHLAGGPSGTMRYQLPSGVSCKHCVIQWYWATANSCAPRGLLEYMKRNNNPFGTTCESDGGGRGTYRAGMSVCGGTQVPEEFWSCADVQITSNGANAGPVKAVGSGETNFIGTEEELKNPKKTLDEAQEELEEGIDESKNETPKQKKKERLDARKGVCLLHGDRCDGGIPCCDDQQVCVYSARLVGFSCQFWWSLYLEVEFRREETARIRQ